MITNCISREISECRFWQSGTRMCRIRALRIMNGKKPKIRKLKESTGRSMRLRRRTKKIMISSSTIRSILLRVIFWVRQRRLISYRSIRVRAQVRHLMMTVAIAVAVLMTQVIHRANKAQSQKKLNSKPRSKLRNLPSKSSNNPCLSLNIALNSSSSSKTTKSSSWSVRQVLVKLPNCPNTFIKLVTLKTTKK